jgi:hypothetical protein
MSWAKRLERENSSGPMGPFMMVASKITIFMERGNIHFQMAEVMRESGFRTKGYFIKYDREGYGVYLWPDGRIYRGEFKND